MNEEVVFRMVVDASDLKEIMAGHVGNFHGGGGGGGSIASSGGDAGAMLGGGKGAPTNASNPSFMSIFKPLAALAAIEKILGGILKNSQVANTYFGAMGKVFGAAIDMLLIPFIPLFNLIMVGISKLVAWLITSGVLEKIQAVMERAAKYLESIAGWIGKVFTAIKELNFAKLGALIIQGMGAAIKTALSDPLGAIATGLSALAAAIIANKMMGGLPGKALGWGGRAIGMGGSGGGTVARGGGGGLGGMFGGARSLAGGLVAGAASVPLWSMIGGGIGGAFDDQQSTKSNNKVGNKIMNIFRGAGDAPGNILGSLTGAPTKNMTAGVYKLFGQEDPRNSRNTNVTVNQYITGAKDGKKLAEEARSEFDDLGRKGALR